MSPEMPRSADGNGIDAEGQGPVVAFLASGAWADVPPAEVTRIETHGAFVFLAGARACKIKRCVKFPYMDFSTLERRRQACEAEVRINRCTAPSLYLGAEPITRDSDESLRIGGEGEVVEWAVLARRFPQEDLLDKMAEERRLTRELVSDLAVQIAAFHSDAEAASAESSYGGSAALRQTVAESLSELRSRPDWFDPNELHDIEAAVARASARIGPDLDRRKRVGLVRRCHGDLHLGNVCLLDGRPTLFDAIEFNEALAWIDVLHDLAFLLMDLDHRRLRAFSNLLFTSYLIQTEDLDDLSVLPLLLSERALVRAKVNAATGRHVADASRMAELRRDALRYFEAAARYLEPRETRLIAVGGLSGSGKSTLASRLAPWIGRAPGAVHLRSDVIRKKKAGIGEADRLPKEEYTPEATRAVYETMMGMAARILAAGHSVIVDAVFARPHERSAIEAVAERCGVPFRGLWLDAPIDLLASRVDARRNDASDATAEVVRQQAAFDLGELDWAVLPGGPPPEDVEAAAGALLGLARGTAGQFPS